MRCQSPFSEKKKKKKKKKKENILKGRLFKIFTQHAKRQERARSITTREEFISD